MHHIVIRGTVFTNDCYSRPVGSMTKVGQPFTFTSNIHTRNMSDIYDTVMKYWVIYFCHCQCQILKFLPYSNSQYISAPSWYEALYSPMIVTVSLLVHDQGGLTSNMHNRTMSDINNVSCNIQPDCCQIWNQNLSLHIKVCAVVNWCHGGECM